MKIPFTKSLNGKFALRTALIALVVALVVGGLAIMSMRSLSSTATDSVNGASASADPETLAALEALAADVSSASSSLTMMVIVVAVLAALLAGALAMTFAKKLTKPLVLLRNATKASTAVLPKIVEASATGQEMPSLPTIALSSGDELQDLADSIDYLQRTAANIAATEPPALPLREKPSPVAAELVAPEPVALEPVADDGATDKLIDLGGRSHELLTSQMKFIEEMERDEANPANLKRLFKVDHLATRMRRNAESFLVLADKESPRTLNRPVSMHQVVQAASSEIEHFERISISNITGASVNGAVATDLAHLLAELLENATHFSPAEVMTAVGGRTTEHGYLIDIIDHGQGMTPQAIDATNARFAGGTTPGFETPDGIGHEVVARLAQRHGVALKLSATPTGGLTAQVHVPNAALVAPAEPKMQPVAALDPVEAATPPAAADPVATDPVATDPVATDPVATDPVATHPVATDPVADQVLVPEADLGLTSEQQAALDWAEEQRTIDAGAATNTLASATEDYTSEADLLAAAMANAEPNTGPIDANPAPWLDAPADNTPGASLSPDHNLSR